MRERRHHASCRRPQPGRIDRHVPPAENGQALVGGGFLDERHDLGPSRVVKRQECHADGIVAERRQFERDDRTQERIGNLHGHARTVAGLRLGTRSAAVLEVAQCGKRLGHHPVTGPAAEVGEQGNAA